MTDTVQLLKALTPGQVADSNCPYQLLNALKSSSDKLVVFVGNQVRQCMQSIILANAINETSLYSQLDASTLRKASISGSLTQLGGVLSDSKSPLFIPYAKYEVRFQKELFMAPCCALNSLACATWLTLDVDTLRFVSAGPIYC